MPAEQVEQLRPMIVVLLRFIALYSLFDGLNIIFASAIKGAGDTRFVMVIIVVVSGCFLVLPSYLALAVFGYGLYVAWGIVTVYVITLGFCFLARFLTGKWKSMRVIEESAAAPLPANVAESPTTEV
jgi:MATE family multidrug resistance protein